MKNDAPLDLIQALHAEVERLRKENIDLRGERELARQAEVKDAERDRLEDELRSAKIYAESIVETIHEPLLVLKPDLTVNSANPAFYEIFRVAPEQAVGRKIYHLGNGQWNIPSLHELLDKVLPANDAFNDFQVHHDFEDLGHRVMLLNARRLDHVQLILLSIQDITLDFELEAATRKSVERLQRMINIPGVAVMIFNGEGILIDANDWFLQMFGYSREEVQAGSLCWRMMTPPEFFDISEAQMKKLSEMGQIGPYEKQYLHKDGSRSWMVFAGATLGDGNAVEYCIDVNEHKRVEQDLRESEKRFRALVTASSEILFRMSSDWGEMLQLYSQDFLAPTIEPDREWLLKYIPPEDQHEVTAAIDDAIRRKIVFELEHRVRRADGTLGWTSSRAVPMLDENGEILEWFGAASDITERKETEVKLREAIRVAEKANQAKSEFLASMSHEIRTPMTVFMAAIEHLLQTDRNPDRRHLLRMADASAHRLRNLIDDILDFSRIEARKVEIDEEPFDLRLCVQEAVTMFSLQAQENNLKLNMQVAPDAPEKVIGDQNRVGQVLINLISNAVKFTRKGEVRVSVQPRGTLLEFAVADTGVGIPEEKQHLLFKSFSQIDMSFHRQHGGSGLGLAICKGLVELMGGDISVQSREGKGSLFTFRIPLKAATESEHETSRPTIDECDKQLANLRILLVDDEPMIREMITMMLVRRGMQVEAAENGSDALRKWEAGTFDLILMDLQMPDIDGMEATRSIREKEREGAKRTCIIGLTAHVRREIKEECLASGMDRVLVKPINMPDLFSAIDDCFTN